MLDTQELAIFREKLRQYREHMLLIHHDISTGAFEESFIAKMVLHFVQAFSVFMIVQKGSGFTKDQYVLHQEEIEEHIKAMRQKVEEHLTNDHLHFSTMIEDLMDDLFFDNPVTENVSVFNSIIQNEQIQEGIITIKAILHTTLEDISEKIKSDTPSIIITLSQTLENVMNDQEENDTKEDNPYFSEKIDAYLEKFHTSDTVEKQGVEIEY